MLQFGLDFLSLRTDRIWFRLSFFLTSAGVILQKTTLKFLIHPVLLGIYPILSLLATNLGELALGGAFRSLFTGLLLIFLVVLLAKLVFKDWLRTGLAASAILILFYSYGHLYQYLKKIEIMGVIPGRHRYLAVVWGVLFAIVMVLIVRYGQKARSLSKLMNLVAGAAVLLPLISICIYSVRIWNQGRPQDDPLSGALNTGFSLEERADFPDIYYIVLDAYGRVDQLQDYYHIDNREFLRDLEELGFYIAECSQANYVQTELSLSSALNMDYLEKLDSRLVEGSTDRLPMAGLIRQSRVRTLLENVGYRSVAFETGFYWSQVNDADIYLRPGLSNQATLSLLGGFSQFEALLMKTTALSIVLDGADVISERLQKELDYPYVEQRDRTIFAFDQLEKLPPLDGPLFVFAHIISPHQPFVFGPQGEQVYNPPPETMGEEWRAWSEPLFRDQITYLNTRILTLVEEMISISEVPPVIIIQGDHGPELTGGIVRAAILNAYYLPGTGYKLYPQISPVNSFRLVFDTIFGTDFGLTEDLTFSSSYDQPYDYVPVYNTCGE
jgi:hypothetical protein